MFERGFNVYIMNQKPPFSKKEKRNLQAKEGKERFAGQEKDLCPIVGDEPDWERRGRDA